MQHPAGRPSPWIAIIILMMVALMLAAIIFGYALR